MSATSASVAIGSGTPPTGTGPAVVPSASRPAQRKRALAKATAEAPDTAVINSGRTTRRNRDPATTSIHADVGDEFLFTNAPRDLGPTLHGEQPKSQNPKQKAAGTSAGISKPTAGIKQKVVSQTQKEVHIVRRRPSSIWDVTSHFFSRFFIVCVLGVGLGTSFWNWKVGPSPAPSRFSAEVEKLEEFVTKTTKWMQVQLEVVDMKIGQEVGELRKEVMKKIDAQEMAVETEIRNVKDQLDRVDASLSTLFGTGGPLTRKEALELMKTVVDKRAAEGAGQALSLDDVRAVARKVVMQELETHSADGIGKVDYALGSGGGRVVDHSEGYYSGRTADWTRYVHLVPGAKRNHPQAGKVLEPSFGEPGQCLPLKGSNVFVVIALRTAIVPQAITVEHVSKVIAFDLASAPKDFQVFGWREVRGPADKAIPPSSMVPKLLGEFTYNIDHSNVQTFNFHEDAVGGTSVNMIKLHVLSNYGSSTHTCIYRARIHGSDLKLPASVPVATE